MVAGRTFSKTELALLANWQDVTELTPQEVEREVTRLTPLGFARRNIVPKSMSGNAIAPSTMTRWIRRGCAGVKLRPVHVGGKQLVSIRIIAEFFDAIAEVRNKRAARFDQGCDERTGDQQLRRDPETERQLKDMRLL